MDGEAVQRLIDLAQMARGNSVTRVNGVPVAIVPPGYEVMQMPELQSEPSRIVQKVMINDLTSFFRYWGKYSSDASVVFVSAETVTAIFDYHDMGEYVAGWCDHVATYGFEYTYEWREWRGAAGRKMSQVEFAEWLDDHASSIREPDSASIIELAMNLSNKSEVVFSSKVNMLNGHRQFEFKEENVTGNLVLPESVMFEAAVYKGLPVIGHEARLRYRIKDGNVVFWFDVRRLEESEEAARLAVLEEVVGECGETRVFEGFSIA